jgi:hypothetical protein
MRRFEALDIVNGVAKLMRLKVVEIPLSHDSALKLWGELLITP